MARYTTISACDSTTSWTLDTNGIGTGSVDTSVKYEGTGSLKYVRTVNKTRNQNQTLRYTLPAAQYIHYKWIVMRYRWDTAQNQLKLRFVDSGGSTLTTITISTNVAPNVWHEARIPLHGYVLNKVNRLDFINDGDQYTGWTDGQTVTLWMDDIKFEHPNRRPAYKPFVVFEFDDGYQDNLTNALPLFKKYGHVATIGISTGKTAGTFNSLPMLTNSEILQLDAAGWEICSHTVNHTNMSSSNTATIHSEMSQSKATIEALTGKPCTNFIYPFTQYTAESITISQQYYQSATIGTPPRQNFRESSVLGTPTRYLLVRQAITAVTVMSDVRKWIEDSIAYGTLLIIYFHDVNDNASTANTCTLTLMEDILRYCNSRGVRSLTTTQAMREYGYVT